jgi:putative transposase
LALVGKKVLALDSLTPDQQGIWSATLSLVREQVPRLIQSLVEEAATALFGRPKFARGAAVDAPRGYHHGHGQPRRLAMTVGTITVRRPRVRG